MHTEGYITTLSTNIHSYKNTHTHKDDIPPLNNDELYLRAMKLAAHVLTQLSVSTPEAVTTLNTHTHTHTHTQAQTASGLV